MALIAEPDWLVVHGGCAENGYLYTHWSVAGHLFSLRHTCHQSLSFPWRPPRLCPAHSHILPLSLPDLEWLWNQDASRDLLLAVHPPNYIVLWNGDTGTKLWKKSYAENILSFSFDPFDSSNMACRCSADDLSLLSISQPVVWCWCHSALKSTNLYCGPYAHNLACYLRGVLSDICAQLVRSQLVFSFSIIFLPINGWQSKPYRKCVMSELPLNFRRCKSIRSLAKTAFVLTNFCLYPVKCNACKNESKPPVTRNLSVRLFV